MTNNTWRGDVAIITNAIGFNHTNSVPPFLLRKDSYSRFFSEPTSAITFNDFCTFCSYNDIIAVVFQN